jgi:Tol biopolymer transport system component
VTGVSNIWRVDIAPDSLTTSAKPVQVTAGKVPEIQPFASGKREVAFTRPSYNTDIWGVPVNTNEGKVTGQPKRWTRDPGNNVAPSLTAYGAPLSFLSDRTGAYGVWLLDVKSGRNRRSRLDIRDSCVAGHQS